MTECADGAPEETSHNGDDDPDPAASEPGGSGAGRGRRAAGRPGPLAGDQPVRPGRAAAAVTKLVLEGALEGELTEHLGYAHGNPAGRNCSNSNNGTRAKRVLTEIGPIELEVPCDRDSTSSPGSCASTSGGLVAWRTWWCRWSPRVTTREVQAHLAEVYGAAVSRQTISTITDRVLEGLAAWQSRSLDAGAKYWLRVRTEVKNRGMGDVCIVVCNGLAGLPDSISAVWPAAATRRASCTLLRNSSATPPAGTGHNSPKTSAHLHRLLRGGRAGGIGGVLRHLGGRLPQRSCACRP